MARLWPEQHQELTKLARLLASSSGKKLGTTEPKAPVDASQPDFTESLTFHSRPEMWTQSFLIGHAFARVDGATSNYLQRAFPGSSEAHRTTGSVTIENVNIIYKGELAHLPSSTHRITLVDGGERGTIVTWDVLSCGDLLKARSLHDGRVHQVGLVNMTLAKRHENELLVRLGQPPARPKLAANNISELVTRHTERQVHYDKVEVTILGPQEENTVLKTVYITDGVIEYVGIVSLWEDDRGFTDRDFLAMPKTGKAVRMIHPMTADVPPLEATIDYFARWLHKRVFNATVQVFDRVSLNICQVNRTIDPDEGENIKVKCNIVGHHNSRCEIDAFFFGLTPLSPTSLKVFAICFHAGLQDLFSTIITEIHSTWPTTRNDSSDIPDDTTGVDKTSSRLSLSDARKKFVEDGDYWIAFEVPGLIENHLDFIKSIAPDCGLLADEPVRLDTLSTESYRVSIRLKLKQHADSILLGTCFARIWDGIDNHIYFTAWEKEHFARMLPLISAFHKQSTTGDADVIEHHPQAWLDLQAFEQQQAAKLVTANKPTFTRGKQGRKTAPHNETLYNLMLQGQTFINAWVSVCAQFKLDRYDRRAKEAARSAMNRRKNKDEKRTK